MSFDKDSTAEQVTEGLDLTGRTWLITGANSGLGRESARVLALRGARIVATARTADKARGVLHDLGIDGVPIACEHEDLGSVRAAVAAIRDLPPLDGIMANAGVMAIPTLQQRYGIELHFWVNHVAHHALVVPLLDRLAAGARVVVLSSGAQRYAKDRGLELDNLSGEHDYEKWRMYGRSKLANILFARAVARRLEGTGRTANAAHPGVIDTNLGRHVEDRAAMYEGLRAWQKSVEQGAATQCMVAVRPELEGVTGRYFADCAESRTIPQAIDDDLGEALWSATEALISR